MDMAKFNPNFQIMASTHHSLEDYMLGDCPKDEQQQQQQLEQQQQHQDKKPRPNPETSVKCPRCESTNTKFCYYNNYSLSQPRYFCKGCRRYWTKGGSLRNVPVGGGCRKNKKPSKRTHDQPLTPPPPPLPPSLPLLNPNPNPNYPNLNSGFLDILRSGFLDNNNSNSNNNNCYGFDGGFMSSTGSQEENKVMMGLQWQLGHVDVDSGGVGSSWHGLLNRSFIG